MNKWDLVAVIVVAIVATIFVAAVVSAVIDVTRFGDTVYTYEGELVNVETSAGGFGSPARTTLYFKDGTVFAFHSINEPLILHENYQLRYYNDPLKLVSIEMMEVC